MIATNKHSSKLKDWCLCQTHHIQTGRGKLGDEHKMINLLQENIEMKDHRTNSTFGFLPTHRQMLKNQKSYFLPTRKMNRINNLTDK